MNDVNAEKEWFADWFESPYYDLLYTNRDEKEAAFFLDNLLEACHFKKGGKILDMPCGKGRHSVYLHKKGFNVTGADLSKRSIAYAKQFEKEGLHFFLHDMRDPLPVNNFDLALNLFTSFGYFEKEEENVQVLSSIKDALHSKGHFVLDYLNGVKIGRLLVPKERKEIKEASFLIERSIENGFVVKKITLTVQSKIQHFIEKVRLYSAEDLIRLLDMAGLKTDKVAGDYALNSFVSDDSDRLILIATKK